MENEKKFIQISNDFFNLDKNGLSIFHRIGTEGFTIFCVLLFLKKNTTTAVVTIKMLQAFLNRDVTKKKKATEGLSDKRTIVKYLIALQRVGLIEKLDNPITNKIKLNEVMLLKFNYDVADSWSGINEKLLIDFVHKLGHIGWSIYCLLFRLHNTNFGGQVGNDGFANPSEKYMGEVLNRHESTIKNYIPLLERYYLVKIMPQPHAEYVQENGDVVFKYTPNHYYVRAKVQSDNKYYIEFNKKS